MLRNDYLEAWSILGGEIVKHFKERFDGLEICIRFGLFN